MIYTRYIGGNDIVDRLASALCCLIHVVVGCNIIVIRLFCIVLFVFYDILDIIVSIVKGLNFCMMIFIYQHIVIKEI